MRSWKLPACLVATFVVASLSLADLTVAQDLHPSRRPSPMGMARTHLGDIYVRVVYSRPYKRHRDNIFGPEDSSPVVPFGKLWRTGANEATEITVTGDVMIGDKKLPAGTYSLFTTPGAESWTFHFNSALGLSGTARFNPETRSMDPGYLPENDVVTLSVPAGKSEEEVDQLTFSFEDQEGGGTHMILRWINTEVRVPIKPAG